MPLFTSSTTQQKNTEPCPGLMHETGHSGRSELVHWDDPEGWDGEGGGRGVIRMGNTCTPMADS